jgi:tetratricopeptide (TPR) repeat protein
MNLGFIRPEFPEQVVYSYYQSSLIFDLIEEQWGLPSILAMLEGYRRGQSTPQLFREVLGTSSRAFDGVFENYVQARLGERMLAVTSEAGREGAPPQSREGSGVEALRQWVLENPGNFHGRLSLGRALYREGRHDEAAEELMAAQDLFPEYPGPDGPLFYLARVRLADGKKESAAQALTQLGQLSETLPEVHAEAASLWTELGEKKMAAESLENLLEVVPFDLDAHEELSGLYEDLGEWAGAVKERKAILALDPVDRADAHYRLAVALWRNGDRDGARSQVLRALEIAPTFEAALELLLELRGDGQAGNGELRSTMEKTGGVH